MSGWPVISSSKYYTENIFAFLEFYLKLLGPKVKSYIKDTNDILREIDSIPRLPDNVILCTLDVLGLYSNIHHDEGLIALRKSLEFREDKAIFTGFVMDLTVCVLKDNIFKYNLSFFKQPTRTVIGTEIAPSFLWETWKNGFFKTAVLNH